MSDIRNLKFKKTEVSCFSDGSIRNEGSTIKTFGYKDAAGYMQARVGKYAPLVHRLIAEAFLDNWDAGMQVDHINGNKSDNRACNLRMVTPKMNKRGFLSKKTGASSKYRGVSVNPSGTWRGSIKESGKTRHLGAFSSEIEAAIEYDRAAIELGYDAQALNSTHFKELNTHTK